MTRKILARDVKPGMKLVAENGAPLLVKEIAKANGFKVTDPDDETKTATGLFIFYADGLHSLVHPKDLVPLMEANAS